MEPIQNILSKFAEKHPNWMWYIARLILIIVAVNICIYGFSAFLLVLYPFIAIVFGYGVIWCLLWFLLPFPVFVVWTLVELIRVVYDDHIDTGNR